MMIGMQALACHPEGTRIARERGETVRADATIIIQRAAGVCFRVWSRSWVLRSGVGVGSYRAC